MAELPPHDREYMRDRLRQELARGLRYRRQFAVLTFEAVPSTDGMPIRRKVEAALEAVRSTVRPSDVVGRIYEDAILLLLVETDRRGAQDALLRIRYRVARTAGNWLVTLYTYPEQQDAIQALPLLAAA